MAEPPLFQPKAAYCETRGVDLGVEPFYRILLAGDGWSLMEKPLEQARLWKVRAAEEQADSMLPKTVPPFTSSLMWLLTGNSIATRMAALGVGELHAAPSRIGTTPLQAIFWLIRPPSYSSGLIATSAIVPSPRLCTEAPSPSSRPSGAPSASARGASRARAVSPLWQFCALSARAHGTLRARSYALPGGLVP